MLLRHGDAARARAGSADRDRPLSQTGHEQIRAVAAHIASRRWFPQRVWSSPAQRASQSAHELLTELARLSGAAGVVQIVETLYEAAPGSLLRLVQECEPDVQSLLVVAHNPALSLLARMLAPTPVGKLPDAVELPTAGLACIEFTAEGWEALDGQSVAELSLWRGQAGG